jgi:lysozyme
MNIEILRQSIIDAEGLRLKPYKDTEGKLTIGVGRNLDDIGISKEEAFFLLDNDIKFILKELSKLSDFQLLSEARQRVIAEMGFNMGMNGLMKFKDMWKAIEQKNWENAAEEMSDSLWARQVGQRAVRLIARMRSGMDVIPKSV